MLDFLLLFLTLAPFFLLLGLNSFQSGHQLPVKFQATGQGAVATLNVKGWNLDEEVLIFDVTHTGTGGRTARIAGKADTKGTVNADFDADVPPYLPAPSIRAGTTGVILCFVTPNKAVQIPVIISKLHFESAIENELKYSFDYQENVLAGVVVYPATAGV